MAELGLAIAGLTIGLPSLVEGTQKLGRSLVSRIKHVEDDYEKLHGLVVQINQSQTTEMINFFFDNDSLIPESLQNELLGLFQALRNIYEELLVVFPEPNDRKPREKLSQHKGMHADKGLRKLEDWNERFLKRAMVFKLFGQRAQPQRYTAIDEKAEGVIALRKVERLRNAVLDLLDKSKAQSEQLLIQNPEDFNSDQLPHSKIYECQPQATGSPVFLAEFRTYSDNAPDREVQGHRKIVREIAGVLRHADPQVMGLLRCRGFYWNSLENRFEIHLSYPQGHIKPRTLLDMLADPDTRKGPKHPLNHRIDLAKKIVSALFVLHSADMVHKQIRPDNILIFEKEPDALLSASERDRRMYPYVLGEPFLIGFDAVRKADAGSQMLHVGEWQKSIYLSPERHRLQAGDEFRMQHDLYSLGVVLLEIAFWASFQDKQSRDLGRLIWKDGNNVRAPEELKKMYLSLASGAISRLMGQKYSDVVKACLSGLEDKIKDKSLEDADGIVVGTAYITEIIKGLEDIRL